MKNFVSRVKGNLSYTFDYTKKTVLTVECREHFTIETEDALSGIIETEEVLLCPENLKPLSDYDPPMYNPVTGPVFIIGVEKGDLLKVKIEKIIPGEIGVTGIFYGAGPFCESNKWPELGKAYTKITKHTKGPSGTTRDGKVIYNEKIAWDIAPMVGTIGLAPEVEIHSSLVGKGPSYGNWDCRDIKEESILYLNSYHTGGLFFLGDVHAGQGDGEFSTCGNDTKAEVQLSCEVVKNKRIPYARIEKKDSIIALYSDKPLEDAVEQAIDNLMEWMIEDYNMKPRDAYVLITINPEFRINVYQMAKLGRIQYTVGAEFPKKYLIDY